MILLGTFGEHLCGKRVRPSGTDVAPESRHQRSHGPQDSLMPEDFARFVRSVPVELWRVRGCLGPEGMNKLSDQEPGDDL